MQNKNIFIVLAFILLVQVVATIGIYALLTRDSQNLFGEMEVSWLKDAMSTSSPAATNVTIGTTSTLALTVNTARKYASFVNDSSATIYLNLSSTTAYVNKGIRLNSSGGSYEILPENLYIGRITAVATSAAGILTITEK